MRFACSPDRGPEDPRPGRFERGRTPGQSRGPPRARRTTTGRRVQRRAGRPRFTAKSQTSPTASRNDGIEANVPAVVVNPSSNERLRPPCVTAAITTPSGTATRMATRKASPASCERGRETGLNHLRDRLAADERRSHVTAQGPPRIGHELRRQRLVEAHGMLPCLDELLRSRRSRGRRAPGRRERGGSSRTSPSAGAPSRRRSLAVRRTA